MKSFLIKFSIVLFLFALVDKAQCQTALSNNTNITTNWFVNGSFGISQFYGDMSNENPFKKLKTDSRIGLSLSAGKMIIPCIGYRGQIYYGQLKSSRHDINEYFVAKSVIEGNISMIVNFVDLFFGFKEGKKFAFFGTIGMGLTSWKSTRYQINPNALICSSGNDRTTEFVLPLSLGFSYKVQRNLSINLENSWHIVNSDKLDKRSGGAKFDSYTFTSAGLTYSFNFKQQDKVVDSSQEIVLAVNDYEEELIADEAIVKEPLVDESFESEDVDDKDNDEIYVDEEVQEDIAAVPGVIDGAIFRVQIMACKSNPLTNEEIDELKLDDEIIENISSDGLYLYSVGSFDNLEEAKEYKEVIRTRYGIQDAFVVGYIENKRVYIQEMFSPSDEKE